MTERWIEITDANGTRREPLRAGLTRVGGGDAEVPLSGTGADELHLWDDPPRAVFVGAGAQPRCAGAPFAERGLAPGDRIEWAGALLEVGEDAAKVGEDAAEVGETAAAEASLEEIAPAPAAPVGSAGTASAPLDMGGTGGTGGVPTTDAGERTMARLRAGLLVDLGLSDPAVVKRWQRAVVDGSFDADLCAGAVAAASRAAPDDPRMRERAGRLLRDFVMAPTTRGARGASRRVRQAARGGVAFVLAQGIALFVYSVIVLVALLLLRVRDVSLDGFLDRILFRN